MVELGFKYVVKTTQKRGGMAHIESVGVTVAGIAIMLDGGDSLETVLSAYPGLTKEHVEEALEYRTQNHKEIERDIHELTHPPARPDSSGIIYHK